MQLDVHLQKDGDATPWGFRLTGGADCDVPLTVTKVTENSIAETAGMQLGDVLVKINHMHVMGLTHEEVHDLIAKCGNKFDIEINRGHWDDLPEKNEIDSIQSVEGNKKSVHFDPENVTDEEIAEVISGEAEVLQENVVGVNFDKTDHLIESEVIQEINQQAQEQQINPEEKKWSTFLQRPNNPPPVYRKVEFGPTAPPYKVVIVKGKQPPKNKGEEEEEEQNQIHEVLISNEQINVDEEYEEEHKEEEIDENFLHADQLDRISEVSERNEEIDFHEFEQHQDETEEELDIEDDEDKEEEKPQTPLFSLQEQLAQLQSQLISVSAIPSELQEELETVAQHLVKIIQQTQTKQVEEETKEYEEDHSIEDCLSAEITDDCETPKSFLIYDSDSEKMLELLIETDVENSEESQIRIQEEDAKKASEEDLFKQEEEKDRQEKHLRLLEQKQELEEFQQRRLEQRPTLPLNPVQRPIILPGGRRWVQPEDAQQPRRRVRMTDERICETIETYSETITGRLKGINFLKYQPPPKNLDFLQKSEVFRLIHDVDEPTRGIASRPAFIPAEQDYRTEVK